MSFLSLISSPLAKRAAPTIMELIDIFKGDVGGQQASAFLDKVEAFVPVLKAAKDIEAVSADDDLVAGAFSALGLKVDAENISAIRALIPQFAESPEQSLLSFITGGPGKKMVMSVMSGKKEHSDTVTQCPGCNLCFTHLQ